MWNVNLKCPPILLGAGTLYMNYVECKWEYGADCAEAKNALYELCGM